MQKKSSGVTIYVTDFMYFWCISNHHSISLFWIVKIFCWEGFESSMGLLPHLYLYLWPLSSTSLDSLFPPSIYLATLGLNCSMKNLLLWHVGSNSLTRDQAWAPCLRSTVLTTGPPGKSCLPGLTESPCICRTPRFWEDPITVRVWAAVAVPPVSQVRSGLLGKAGP